MTETTIVPAFRRGVKFRFDAVRDAWVLLAPEKLFMPDEIAVEILKLIDGAQRSQRLDRRIEVAMLRAQRQQSFLDLARFHPRRCAPPSRSVQRIIAGFPHPVACGASNRRQIGETMV